jgi:hypothetical protein
MYDGKTVLVSVFCALHCSGNQRSKNVDMAEKGLMIMENGS